MGLTKEPRTLKLELNRLATEYQQTQAQETLVNIIALLEPLIRGRVASLIYSYERQFGRHTSDFEDLCQEVRLRIAEAVNKWEPSRGGLHAFANIFISSRLKTMLGCKHNHSKSKILDYQVSLDLLLYSGDGFVSDKMRSKPFEQEEYVGALELSNAVSEALSEEMIQSSRRRKIFLLLLRGENQTAIAKTLNIPQATVRMTVRKVIRRVQRRLPAVYKTLYQSLSPDFLKQVRVRYVNVWM